MCRRVFPLCPVRRLRRRGIRESLTGQGHTEVQVFFRQTRRCHGLAERFDTVGRLAHLQALCQAPTGCPQGPLWARDTAVRVEPRCPVVVSPVAHFSILARLVPVDTPPARSGSYAVALDPYLGAGDAKSGLVSNHQVCCSLHSGDLCSPCGLGRAADGRRLLTVDLHEVPREDVASGIALTAHSATVTELAGVCRASVASERQNM
jgi:hypothetical protein